MLQSRDFAIRYESGGTKQYLYIKFNCTADCIKLRKKYLLWFVLHCTALADRTEPKFIWMTSCEEVIHSILQVPVICDCRKQASRLSDYSQVCKRMHPLIHSYPSRVVPLLLIIRCKQILNALLIGSTTDQITAPVDSLLGSSQDS